MHVFQSLPGNGSTNDLNVYSSQVTFRDLTLHAGYPYHILEYLAVKYFRFINIAFLFTECS